MSEQVQRADGGCAEGPRSAEPAAGRRSHPGQAAAGGQQAGLQPRCQVQTPSLSLSHPPCFLDGGLELGIHRWALQMPRVRMYTGPILSCPFSAALLQPRSSSAWGGPWRTALPVSGHTHRPSTFSDPDTELSLSRRASWWVRGLRVTE